MTLNPVETLNTFSAELKNNLRQRSYSQELVRTRAPFLRFTTGANMSELQDKLGTKFREYTGCSYFTLGLHGWNNYTYKQEDIYGTQNNKGLVVGLTYKQGEQKVVYTHGTRTRSVSNAGIATTTSNGAQNYPPPGITNAKIERLRNGNVFRATIDMVVYTQEQLELLDTICFVPGMTCIIEWGSMQTTPSGPYFFAEQGLKTLDFTEPEEIRNKIYSAKNTSRKNFIKEWCEPNGFHYDWAVGNIANVKTKVEDNTYKVSIIVYGRADNIMYISAYATTTALLPDRVPAEGTPSSVNYYFRLNGGFSSLLKRLVLDPESKVISFTAPMDQLQVQNTMPMSQTFGFANELGFEDTYFISFDVFINTIMNGEVLSLINVGLPEENKLDVLIAPVSKNPQKPNDIESDTIQVGYNEFLRSVDPQVLIIYNKKAIQAAKSPNASKTSNVAASGLLRVEQGVQQVIRDTQQAAQSINQVLDTTSLLGGLRDQGLAGTQASLDNNEFGSGINTASETTNLLKGVYINSKAIQSAFMNARTIFEGLEVLLRNINSATENYWNLKLYYDDDIPAYRILDDNVRLTSQLTQQNPIYEFNKPLQQIDDRTLGKTTIGPDVLDIEINTDYPKLVFAKLATAAINGGSIVSDADRTDLDFNLGARVGDLFVPTRVPATAASPPPRPPGPRFTDLATLTRNFRTTYLARTVDPLVGANNFSSKIENELNAAFAGQPISPDVSVWISDLMNRTSPLTLPEAMQLRESLKKLRLDEKLSEVGYTALLRVAKLRTEGIIRFLKDSEAKAFEQAVSNVLGSYSGETSPRTPLEAAQSAQARQLLSQGFAADSRAGMVARAQTPTGPTQVRIDQASQTLSNKVNSAKTPILSLITASRDELLAKIGSVAETPALAAVAAQQQDEAVRRAEAERTASAIVAAASASKAPVYTGFR